MKIKTFILTFLMMSCSIVFGQTVYEVSSEALLRARLNRDCTIKITEDFSIETTVNIPNGREITIDLNGHKLSTKDKSTYIFNNQGLLTIKDSDPEGKGAISACGIYNGKTFTRTAILDVNYEALLTIESGVFNNISSDGGAAIENYGVLDIFGGEFYGEYSAITNYGVATIENAYIECLNRDNGNGPAAIRNDFEMIFNEGVEIVGRYTKITDTGKYTGEPTYLFAELDGTKYTSLQAALEACTTGDNTINLLFHNSEDATVSQKEGVNITIDGNGYKEKQFEYSGTIYVNGNSRHTGAETLTIQDINFVTTDNKRDFISCDDGTNSEIRYAHNVTVENCNFTATEASESVVALRFRQSYNINVVGGTFTNLHSAMWATGTSGIIVNNITADCKEGGISLGTSTDVEVKNSTIEGAQYGVRADGSGNYSLNIEGGKLTAAAPVIVRNTTAEYNLTVNNNVELVATANGPQVVVTAAKDDAPYVVPTSDVNVTLYNNVTSTFGLTAKIGNAFYATLQDAVDNAKTGETVTLIADNCKEDVTVNQAPNYVITIDGAEKTFKGTITVDGKSARYETTGLTIKNVNFDATEGISADACINLGAEGNSNTRYTNNVTVESCTFVANISDEVPAVKSYTGGDWNLKINNCTVNEGMHSLAQVTNVEKGMLISGCKVYSKNGINLNSSAGVVVENSTFETQGYAVRVGVNGGTSGAITLNNNTLKSACEDGDAVIIVRGSAVTQVDLSMEKNVVSGTTHISGNTTDTNIDADANYWGEGLTGPVVAGTNVDVNSYYADEAREQLIVTALTLQQFVEKVTEGNGTYNGTFTEGGVEKNITVKVVPVSGDARSTNDVRVPNRLQKYTNPEVYYAQYQRFSELTDVNISNVNFVFYPAAVTVTDAWNTAGATTTADNINGELQLLNTGSVSFANCSFDKMSVSPINAAKLSVTSSTFNGLDAYAIKDVKATTATITGTTFTDCNGGFWFNNAPTTLTVTGNTFTGTGRRGAIQFSANGDYANTEMTVTGNEVTDDAAFLWQLNNTISNAQLNAILDKNNNTYETAFVEGSVELHLQGEGTADNPYLINDISDLEFFRDQVNAGNTYEGKYIKVTATEIDLNNEEWTPIAYKGKTFKGNFDGNNVTVKNLKITKALTNSAENNGIGFFGRTDSPATIENIIIENVDITGSLYVGAIVGYGYTGKHVKGCTVKGDITIDAWWYAGVIGGNGYMNLVDDCHVIGNEDSYIKGNDGSYIGGIWGFRGEGNNKITNCTVTNLNIIGVDRVGGICGIGHYGNTISGCDAEDVTVTATDPDATTIGLLVGATQGNDISGQGPTIFEDNDASGITAQIDNGDGTYTEVTNLYGTNINGSTPVTNYVAQIVGGTQYATLAEAVAAAVNNDVITLLPTNAPIAMNAALYGKDVTITGTATVDWSKGFLFVGRGGEGNAKLTFESANLTSASNSSSYGIHVSGREKNTNNKYDGTLVINNSTIDLDYLINRGTIELDGGNLTVKNGFGIAGRPGTETESGEDATATITLNNESKVVVNNHNGMGLGIAATQLEGFGIMNINSGSTFETTQSFTVTAKGTMNVNGGNVKVDGKLTNKGTVNVTGNASMNVTTTADSNPINFNNVTIANANIGGEIINGKVEGGAVNAFGTNNFTGETNIEGILSVGYDGSPAEQVVVNITGNFNGGNVLIGISNDNVLNVGNAEGTKTTAHFGQIGAFGDVNIVNADVTYGYAFIRNDFNVTNSTMEIKGGVNTYFAGNAKVVLDNTTWNLPGYANIGSYGGYMYGKADVTLKNGSVMNGTNLGIEVSGENVVKVTLEGNSRLEATKLTNQGSIVLDDVEAKVTSNELTGTNNVPTTTVADHKVVYENGAYVVTAKHYVAQVKGTDNNVRVKFETFAEALDVVENGETIELLGTEGSEISKEIDFTKDIEFTITGTAPNYALPVVTFQNAKVNIKDAEILIPELDARQNATINVINSTVYDAGGDGIVKSYYNGAINIDVNSTVYTMQVTTMGYITVAGTLNATWQTNVYGNGLITLNEGATFNTAALHLTGQDYSDRDNTDLERVGKPAEIVVDGANFTVGNVHSAGGADYSYNSGEGINVGTVVGKSAILNIKNGGNVNIYMANGETANIGAGGTVNIAASTLNTICRAENGTVTLANNGTVYVTGEANLDATVTGAGWFYMNGVALDADTKLHGAKVGFINGVNTIVGSTIDGGFFSVGIGQNDAATAAAAFATANDITLGNVTVNVSGDAIIDGNGESYSGWVGSAYSADKTQHIYTLNVENSLAAFGYMHVSKDGIMNINGRSADDNKYTQDNSNVNFYAGDLIVNGNVTINDADAWVRYTKMSPDHADGVLNITGDTKYESSIHNGGTTGTSLVFYKAGKVNIANGTTIEIDNATTLVDGAELNIASANVIAKGDVTGNGAINFTNDAATLKAQEGLTINYDLNPDKKVVYVDGVYKVVEKVYVAQIGDVKFESLQAAIDAAKNDETITMLVDVNVTTPAYGQNALNYARAISFTLDLNGKTLSANTGNSVFRFNISGSGATEDVTVTIKNGTVVSGEDTWCTLMSSGISADVRAVMNLEDLVIENYKGGDFAVKAWANGVVNAKNVTINASYGGGFYALGGEITLDNCTVKQEGLWTAPYLSMTVGVSNGGKMTVNSGTYSAVPHAVADGNNQGTSHGSWCGGVMSSGGTLVINGGTFSNGNIGGTAATNPRELFIVGADADYGDNVNGQVIIKGGTFTSIGDFIHCETIWGSETDPANDYMPTMGVTITAGDFTAVAGKTIGGCDPVSTGNPVDVEISGGTYGANHAIDDSYLVVGYIVVDNPNGTYSVVEDQVAKIGDVTYKLLQEAFDAAQDGDEIVVLKDITYTKANGYVNVNSDYIDGLVYTGDKSFTVDFGGYTITDNGEINDYLVYLKNTGGKDNEITFKNGTIAIKAERTNTAWAAITVGANSATYKTTLNLNDMEVVNGNPNKANNQVIRTRNGATVNLNNETVVTSNGTSYGVVAETSSTVNIKSGAKVVQQESDITDGNVVYTAVSGNGTINIYDGATIESDRYAIHNMTSGNTVINIYGGTIKADEVAVHVATNGGNGESAVANISGGTFTGKLETYSNAASIVITGGTFTGSLKPNSNIVITGGIYSEKPLDGFIVNGYKAYELPDSRWSVRLVAGTQTREFASAGWYWFSTYIQEMEGQPGLDNLKNALNGKAIEIKSQHGFTHYYPAYQSWTSGLTSLSTAEMYMIQIATPVTVELDGNFVEYENRSVSLYEGWNWIGYPVNEEVDINIAFMNHTPMVGDILKGQNETSEYYEGFGWFPTFNLKPGYGYMYKSTQDATFTFNIVGNKNTNTDVKTVVNNYHWNVDPTQYPNNMTVFAMVEDVEGDDYEVAALVNGEVRGSARPVYFEPLNAYILVLTISGNDVEEMTFMYYDNTTGEEVEFSNRINYSSDAVVGSIAEPYMLTRGTTGIGEAEMSQVNIYPNPTTTGTEINLQATCDKVEVFNALGAKVAEYQNVDSIDALETAGIYVIRITNDSNVKNCKLVVR